VLSVVLRSDRTLEPAAGSPYAEASLSALQGATRGRTERPLIEKCWIET